MQNPILQLLSRGNKQNNQSDLVQRISLIKQLLAGKNSNVLYNELLKTNPQFRDFVKNAEGKTIEDLAMEYDIDINLLKQFL